MSDVIYYNIIMSGNRFQTRIPAEFEETRTQPLLEKPNDYYLSVVRFSIDGSWIPLLVCPVIYDVDDPTFVNLTPFIISVTYGNIEIDMNLIFIPESDAPIPVPPTNINVQDLSTNYYYIYNYDTFVTMINNAINDIYNGPGGLFAQVPGLNATPVPYITYDSETQKFSFIIPNIDNPLSPGTNLYKTQFDTNNYPVENVPNAIKIFMNEQLISLIDGFEYFTYEGPNLQPFEVLLLVKDSNTIPIYPPQYAANLPTTQTVESFSAVATTGIEAPPGTTTTQGFYFNYTANPVWWKITQQYKTISLFNSISSIVFTTMSIPVQYEYIPTSTVVGSANNVSGNIGFRSVLTDFVPSLMESGDVRTRLIYNPTAQFG